jgi:hypothetical protein
VDDLLEGRLPSKKVSGPRQDGSLAFAWLEGKPSSPAKHSNHHARAFVDIWKPNAEKQRTGSDWKWIALDWGSAKPLNVVYKNGKEHWRKLENKTNRCIHFKKSYYYYYFGDDFKLVSGPDEVEPWI